MLADSRPGPHLNTNAAFPGTVIPVINIRRSWDPLTLYGNSYTGQTILYWDDPRISLRYIIYIITADDLAMQGASATSAIELI